MGSARKHFALDWIKSDLLETLDEARVALDDYAEQGGDETCLRLCLARLHQVHGTLLMLELKGVTLLADHLERTAQALVDGYVISESACAQLLMQGVLELPGYLDEIQRGGNDEIGTFLPLVNELRDHLGEPALDDPAGLSLSAVAPDDVVNKFTRLDGSEKVTRMRSAYQNVLLTILKGEDRADAVDTFKKIATGLQKLTEGSALERQWQAFGEFVASLGQKEGALDADAVKLLRRVDIELKSLATEGETALRRPANMELMAQLLDATQEREYATGLTDVLREAVSRDTSNSTLAISGRQATTVAAVALREELAIIKDKLDLFSRASSVDLHGLGDLIAPLQQIGSTLSLLGFESSREIVMDQVGAIEDLVLLSDADPEGLQNVAAALAQVDENLYSFSSDRTEIEQITEEAQLKLLEEARKGLDQLKTAVVDFVSTHWDVRHLSEVPATFAEIRGALDIIPLPRVNALLDLLVGYVERQLMNGHRPDWQELDRFADAVSGADYFLERLGELNAAGAEEVLLMAERATEDLLHYSSESEKHPGDESMAHEPENTLALDDLEFVADLPDQVADPESVELDEWTLDEVAHVENEQLSPESLESHFDVAAPTFAEDEGAGGIPELELDVDNDADVPDSSRIAEAQSELSEAHNSLGDDAGAHAERETGNREQLLDASLVSMEDENIALEKEGDEAFDLSSTVYADVDGRIERHPDERKVSGSSISTDTEAGVEQTVLEGPAEQDEDAARPVDGRAAPSRPEIEHLRGDAEPPDPEIVEIFVEEVEEVLENVALELPKWAAQFSDSGALAEVRRAFHTLKGSGRIVNAVSISELAWGVENMLNRVIEGTVEADDQFVQVVESACTAMPELLSSFQNGSEGDFEQVALLVEAADVLASGGDLDASFRSSAQASVSDESSNSTPEAAALQSASGGELSAESDSPAISERSPASERGDVLIDSPEAREPSAYELFIEEAGEYLVVLSAEMAQEPWHISDEIVRAFHTLRGSSVLVGCREVSAIVDPANLVVEAWREHTTHEPIRDFCLTAVEQLSDCLDALVNGVAWQGAIDLRTQADELLALALIEAEPSLLEASVIGDLFEAEDWIGDPIEHSERLLTTFSDFVQVAQAAEKESLAELGAALLHMLTIASVSEVLDVKRLRFGYELLLDQLNAMATGSVDGDAEQISAFISSVEASPEEDTLAQPSETVLDELEETMDDEPGELAGPDKVLEAAAEPATQSPLAVSFNSLDVDEDLVMVFFEEAEEISEEVESSIVSWSQEMENRLFLENLLRALHTLKGGARLCGLVELGDMAHDFESIVIDVQNEDRRVDAELFTELHTRHDAIVSHLTRFREALFETGKQEADLAVGQDAPGQAPDEAVRSSLGLEEAEIVPLPSIEELTLSRAAETPANTDEPTAAQTVTTSRAVESVQSERPQPRPSPPSVLAQDVSEASEPDKPQVERPQTEMVRVGASLLEELVNLAGENSIVRARIEQGMSDFTGALDEMETTIERLREQLRRLEIETETQILYRHERLDGPDYENFDPLEMDRYSQLQQLSRGLSESASDMLDLKETLLFKARESETLLLQQARINTELQEGLMRTRMVPFSRLIPRLRRTVRQVSGELGKDVEFHIQNAEGELDRNLLERMVPPLEHMLRNAVDHGIEAAEIRRNFGKPGPGRIDLCLSREGGDVVIEISDDGAGIDVESVREKAIERGLTSASAYLGDDETLQFILAPGFSTAKSVTQISGRGVGMDVVNSEVKQLGGSISIASQPGKGSRFVLRLPFTVSVNRALMVSVADDLYAIPLNNIEGIVLLGEDEIARLHEGGENTFEYAGVPYRVRYLGQYLGREYRGTQVGQTTVPLVLVHSGDHAVAVHVDAVQGSREIVVKSLGPQFAGVGGISGATILGDGNVVVILDLLALIRAQRDLNAQQIDRSAPALGRPRSVLVVDDSVTVRKVTSRLLERQGMDVLVAKDGVEAVALLQEQRPDVMLLDIEMPRMDGFEVARQVRHDERLENLPIVMVSSRTGDKHKEHASQLGVDRFLGKPFQENELLATIDELVTRT